MSRRGSASFVPKALPFRILHTVEDAGKIVSASKKVCTWRFGYPDVEKSQCIVLKHSVTGGRKVILENDKEVVNIGAQHVITDFAHGWESQGHVLRVAVSAKGAYTFSVDGVEYDEFPSEMESKKMHKEIMAKMKGDDTTQTKTRRSNSVTKKADVSSQKRNSATFDPFASDSSTGPKSNAVPSSSFFDESQDSFGGGFDSSDPFASNTKSTDPFSAGFDTTPPASTPTSTVSSKLFDNVKQEKKPSPALSRQFTSSPDQSPQKPGNSSFDSNDLFADKSTRTPPAAQQKQQQPAASINFFDEPSPPKSQQQQQNQPHLKPPPGGGHGLSHKQHEQQQQQQQQQPKVSGSEFDGLVYDLPPTPTMQHNQSFPDMLTPPQAPQQQHQHQHQQQPVEKGRLYNGLVDLDLSSPSTKPAPQQRKSIYEESPTPPRPSGGSAHTSAAVSSPSINPFDDFHCGPAHQQHHPQQQQQHYQQQHYQQQQPQQGYQVQHAQPQYNNAGHMGHSNSNWMASGNIAMMTEQSGFMNQQHGKPPGNKSTGSSLDTLNWKM